MKPIHTISLRAYLKAANRHKARKEFLFDEYQECLDVIAYQPEKCVQVLEDILEFYEVSSVTELDLQWLRAFAASGGHAAQAFDEWTIQTDILYDWVTYAGFDIEYDYETEEVYPIDNPDRYEIWDDLLTANADLGLIENNWDKDLI